MSQLSRQLSQKATALLAAVGIALFAPPEAVSAEPHALTATPAASESLLTPEYIVNRLQQRNRELDTYQAHVRVEFRLHSFPYFREHLDGTAYFKRPSRYEVIFRRVPTYAKGFDHLSADLADASSWMRRFTVTVIGTREFCGHRDIVLRLVQRVRGQIDHQDVAVNPTLWEVDGMEYHYYNGGTIAMQQHFESIGGFRLITAQDAQIQIPYVKAVAHAEYTDYHTNIALTESTMVNTNDH